MKKKMIALLIVGVMGLSMTACGSAEPTASETPKEEVAKTEEAEEPEETVEEVTYQSILDEYTAKIEEATPVLIEEYNAEAAELTGDITALAELSNNKITELAEISTEGMEKMAELMYKNGDDEETYTEWAEKLTDVYMEQSQLITDAYMASAM